MLYINQDIKHLATEPKIWHSNIVIFNRYLYMYIDVRTRPTDDLKHNGCFTLSYSSPSEVHSWEVCKSGADDHIFPTVNCTLYKLHYSILYNFSLAIVARPHPSINRRGV